MVNSRAKGREFQGKIARIFRHIFSGAHSTYQPYMQRGCDVEGTPYWIECKIGRDPKIFDAYMQSLDAKWKLGDDRPVLVVVHKDGSGRAIRAVEGVYLEIGAFLDLARQAYREDTEPVYQGVYQLLRKNHGRYGVASLEAAKRARESISEHGADYWTNIETLINSVK